MNPSQFFEAERVLAMRQRKGKPREYLVKWKHFDRAGSSWQPERHLNKPLLESFRRPSADAGEELQAYVRDLLCDELARCLNRPLQSRICLPCHHRVDFDILESLRLRTRQLCDVTGSKFHFKQVSAHARNLSLSRLLDCAT